MKIPNDGRIGFSSSRSSCCGSQPDCSHLRLWMESLLSSGIEHPSSQIAPLAEFMASSWGGSYMSATRSPPGSSSASFSGVRPCDRLFRLGGDEFAIFMPGLSVQEANLACQRLSLSLSRPMRLLDCQATIGASFGVSEVNSSGADCDAALRSADTALYQAKALGRGGVISASIQPVRRPRLIRNG
ncbi:GGDEF domain-containing protein [Shinella sp. AETb1-6]|uniref:GGDEF domain-containing protein n=1 Tax=Shinella sp. AETb1-6 TaxID=2692210 RepID=UPI00352E40E2